MVVSDRLLVVTVEEYYWADPSQEFATSNGARRQAGQLVLRPDGGFHESSGEPAHAVTPLCNLALRFIRSILTDRLCSQSVQKLAHGMVAMGGSSCSA